MIYKRTNEYNESLKQWQTLLGTTADGYFGPETEAKVKEFQRNNNLTVDGIIGPQTIAALTKSNANQTAVNKLTSKSNINIDKIKTLGQQSTLPDYDVANEKKAFLSGFNQFNQNDINTNSILQFSSRGQIQGNNATSDIKSIEQEKTQLEKDIQSLEEKIRTSSERRDLNYEEAGLFNDMRGLTELKAKRDGLVKDYNYRIQLEGLNELQGRGATYKDLDNLTGQSLRDAALQTTVLNDTIATNEQLLELNKQRIDQQLNQDLEVNKWLYETKLNRLREIENRYDDYITNNQRANLEITKSLIDKEKATNDALSKWRTDKKQKLLELGYSVSEIENMDDTELGSKAYKEWQKPEDRRKTEDANLEYLHSLVENINSIDKLLGGKIYKDGKIYEEDEIYRNISGFLHGGSWIHTKNYDTAIANSKNILSSSLMQNVTDFRKQLEGSVGQMTEKEWPKFEALTKLGAMAQHDDDGNLTGDFGNMDEGVLKNLLKQAKAEMMMGRMALENPRFYKDNLLDNYDVNDEKDLAEIEYVYQQFLDAKQRGFKPKDNIDHSLEVSKVYSTVPQPKIARSILDTIAEGESNLNYNAYYTNANNTEIPLSNFTLKQVYDFQDKIKSTGSTAVGKYQFIQPTLKSLQKKLNIPDNAIFSPALQEQMGLELLNQRGYFDYLNGKLSKEGFITNLSKEWAAVPKDASGLSFYDGDGLNKATIAYNDIYNNLM